MVDVRVVFSDVVRGDLATPSRLNIFKKGNF
jgi:hypothetical protein